MENIHDLVNNFVDTLPCKSEEPYPEVKVERENLRYAKLLLDAYADGGKSEMTAISQYLHHHFTITEKEIANAELCIALIEMKHLSLLGDLIEKLGGDPKYKRANKMWWSGGEVSYGDNTCLKLKLDIESEEAAIKGYELLLTEIDDKYVQRVLRRILEDEKVHLKILTFLYNKHCCRD